MLSYLGFRKKPENTHLDKYQFFKSDKEFEERLLNVKDLFVSGKINIKNLSAFLLTFNKRKDIIYSKLHNCTYINEEGKEKKYNGFCIRIPIEDESMVPLVDLISDEVAAMLPYKVRAKLGRYSGQPRLNDPEDDKLIGRMELQLYSTAPHVNITSKENRPDFDFATEIRKYVSYSFRGIFIDRLIANQIMRIDHLIPKSKKPHTQSFYDSFSPVLSLSEHDKRVLNSLMEGGKLTESFETQVSSTARILRMKNKRG